MSSQIMFAL